jgi:hypothetical protein
MAVIRQNGGVPGFSSSKLRPQDDLVRSRKERRRGGTAPGLCAKKY